MTEIRPLAEVEKELILEAILATGSIAKAAAKLNISRPKIYRLLENHHIDLKVSEIRGELRRQRSLKLDVPNPHPRSKRREYEKQWKVDHPDKTREFRRKSMSEWRRKYPEKYAAHQAVNWAVKTGKLKRPSHCQMCWDECKPEGHHQDYSKPLDVIWLCAPCHKTVDGRLAPA